MKRIFIFSFFAWVITFAKAQVTIEINSQPLQFESFSISIKSIELTKESTIIYKQVKTKSQQISVWSSKDQSIVDSSTGRSYNVVSSSVGFTPYESISLDMRTLALVEIYPPLPNSVSKIDITSDGRTCYVKGLNIGSKRESTNAEVTKGTNAYNTAQELAAKNQWDQAFRYYETSALLTGLSMAQLEVALGYERGEGTKVSFPDAFYWMYKSGTNKFPLGNAYLYLGMYYREGVGTFVNHKESLKYFKLGSEKCLYNDYKDECSFYVATAYQRGLGVDENITEAIKWYRKAAENGHTVASHNLGNRYALGEGVTCDFKEAAKWWTIAAQKGYVDSQMNLGKLYRYGEGNVKKDIKQARYWYNQASKQGVTQALIALQEIENE